MKSLTKLSKEQDVQTIQRAYALAQSKFSETHIFHATIAKKLLKTIVHAHAHLGSDDLTNSELDDVIARNALARFFALVGVPELTRPQN